MGAEHELESGYQTHHKAAVLEQGADKLLQSLLDTPTPRQWILHHHPVLVGV